MCRKSRNTSLKQPLQCRLRRSQPAPASHRSHLSLAQGTSLYYFVLQDMHKTHPSTTLWYKTFTNHFPVLLRTTRRSQITSSTTSYWKTSTKHIPVLLRTTRYAQSTSQYYFVLQDVHKLLPVLSPSGPSCWDSWAPAPFLAIFWVSLTQSQNLALRYLGCCCKNFISRMLRHFDV